LIAKQHAQLGITPRHQSKNSTSSSIFLILNSFHQIQLSIVIDFSYNYSHWQSRIHTESGQIQMTQSPIFTNVLTLEEASQYLRLSPIVIAQQASIGNIPGQLIDNDWRFLRSAIDDWLKTRNSRSILLTQAGSLATDDALVELQAEIDLARRNSTVEFDI
jgi:Helix-turn-helix domain